MKFLLLEWCEVSDLKLTGYKRKDGRWGFRNQILVMPLHSALCAIARSISESFPEDSVVSINHDWSGEVDKDWYRISKEIGRAHV